MEETDRGSLGFIQQWLTRSVLALFDWHSVIAHFSLGYLELSHLGWGAVGISRTQEAVYREASQSRESSGPTEHAAMEKPSSTWVSLDLFTPVQMNELSRLKTGQTRGSRPFLVTSVGGRVGQERTSRIPSGLWFLRS